MKKITCIISSLFITFAAIGCSKGLDNSDFVEGIETGEGTDGKPADDVKPDVIGENQLKVISFNVRTGGGDAGTQNAWAVRNKGIPPMFAKENPTVFGVQEALSYQMTFIKENVPGYDCIGVGRDDGGSSGEFMGIFYKTDAVELKTSGTFWLSETPEKPSKGWGANYYRTATWAIFEEKFTGKRFFYMNTHLDHQSAEARKNSILLICEKMKELNPEGYPSMLTADFNSTTDDAIFTPLKNMMQDARATSPETDNLNTYNGWGSGNSIIDHIFYSGFKPVKYRTIQDRWNGIQYISDHYPISAVLEFE